MPPASVVWAPRSVAVDTSLLRLKMIVSRRVFARQHARTVVAYGGQRYRRDEDGAWRDDAGRRADLKTCFALADQEKRGAGA
jgi:hypothetical protein